MKIVLLNTHDISGGAAIAAYRLYSALRLIGQESFMIVKNKKSNDRNIYNIKLINEIMDKKCSLNEDIINYIQDHLINKNRTNLSDSWFSFPYPGFNLSNTQLIKNSDIINLHWVAQFQNTETINALFSLNKPIVWTLHDQWAITGGCHYSAGCEKYQYECKECPQLKDNSYHITHLVLKNKVKYLKNNLVVVTPSNWLADCARKSTLFKSCRIEVIPYSLDIDSFRPYPKKLSKESLNISSDTITLLFGEYIKGEKRKGFEKLLDALKACMKNNDFKYLIKKNKIKILTFGHSGKNNAVKIGIPIKSYGYIDSNEKLAKLYSAADICILPSLEDNLPNIMLESMACGTPLIAFDVGGIPDVVKNGQNGYLAACYDTGKMSEYIIKLIFDEKIRKEMSINCRSFIKKNFSLEIQAERYVRLFQDLTKKNGKETQTGIKHSNLSEKNESIITLHKEECWYEIMPDFFSINKDFKIDYLYLLKKRLKIIKKSFSKY